MCTNFTMSELQVWARLGHLYSATSLCKVLHGRLEVTKLFFKDLQDLTKCLLFGVLYSIIICGSIDSLQVFSLRINQIQRPLSFEYPHARVQRKNIFQSRPASPVLSFGSKFTFHLCCHLESIRFDALFRLSTHMLGCKEKNIFQSRPGSNQVILVGVISNIVIWIKIHF